MVLYWLSVDKLINWLDKYYELISSTEIKYSKTAALETTGGITGELSEHKLPLNISPQTSRRSSIKVSTLVLEAMFYLPYIKLKITA